MHPFAQKFQRLLFLTKVALLAIPLFIAGSLLRSYYAWTEVCNQLAIATSLPCFFYAYALSLWHWKARYYGVYSDLWGVILVVDVSGLSKVIYFLRHVLPDMKGWGVYRNPTPASGASL